jgi:hypothetical protein
MTTASRPTLADAHHEQARANLDVASLEGAIRDGARLASFARSVAMQLGEPDLGDIDLPPATSDADQATIRAVAPLYLAAELESARLLTAVEMLGGVFASGALPTDLGPMSQRLITFWQHRRDRLTAEERQALYGRVFGRASGPTLALPGAPVGATRNTSFESLLLDLAEALSRIVSDPVYGGVPASEEIAVHAAAASLASNVSGHGRGMASVATNELLATITEALAILKDPAVQQAVGARGVWDAVRAIARRYLDEEPNIEAHLGRAKSGMTILSWLAGAAPGLDAIGGDLVAANDPVITAAIEWMQSTLALEEQAPAAARGG